jgi:tRNA-binding protein
MKMVKSVSDSSPAQSVQAAARTAEASAPASPSPPPPAAAGQSSPTPHATSPPASTPPLRVPLQTFSQLEIRVGKILTVDDIPVARKPLYRLTIDFGPLGVKQCAGGIKAYYTKEQLLGKQVVAIVNLEPKSIAGVMSECMMMASFTEADLSLLCPDKEMPPGTKVA